jgi:hypothetical protein
VHCRAILPNAGLGNTLFAWARCRVYSLEHGIPILAPNWPQLKLGPVVRRDRDARVYHNLFRASPPGYLSGRQKLWLWLSTRTAVEEPVDLHLAPVDRMARQVVIFRGERDHFRPITGWDVVLLQELRAMTRERWLRRADTFETVPIGIHVRRGDFAEASSEEDFILRGGIRTPLHWFVHGLTAIRRGCGFAVPAVVVSDAPDAALADLLQLESVTRADTGSAIGDLLVLSKAKLLIASGGSSFSAWAAFLGQMPTVAYPGQSLAWFKIEPILGQYLGEWDHRRPTPPLLEKQIQTLDRTGSNDPSRLDQTSHRAGRGMRAVGPLALSAEPPRPARGEPYPARSAGEGSPTA